MIGGLVELARPMLGALPPEEAHDLTIRMLELGIYPRLRDDEDPILSQTVCGLPFPNPVGIAAGFDKDARVPDAILDLGCGFAEVGTLTPEPQSGNPSPRVFRLKDEHAIINRLGFNNGGHAAALERLKKRRGATGVVGVNIGANKDTQDRAVDYATGITTFYDVASYFTVNISSPNTPGLRDLQAPDALKALLARVMAAREDCVKARARGGPEHTRPIIVKLAPDIAEPDLEPIVDVLLDNKVDGIAISNTTLTRPGIAGATARQGGGLSGRPLFHRSTVFLARVYRLTDGAVPLIGIGGIDSAGTAIEKVKAGASLIQLYTGLVYEGPGLIGRIKSGLGQAARGAGGFDKLCGSGAEAWAAKPLDLNE
ncbi:MAG: quinone-dependent dihydroorotate dehydrogenase [Pseudomonadota bacterium]